MQTHHRPFRKLNRSSLGKEKENNIDFDIKCKAVLHYVNGLDAILPLGANGQNEKENILKIFREIFQPTVHIEKLQVHQAVNLKDSLAAAQFPQNNSHQLPLWQDPYDFNDDCERFFHFENEGSNHSKYWRTKSALQKKAVFTPSRKYNVCNDFPTQASEETTAPLSSTAYLSKTKGNPSSSRVDRFAKSTILNPEKNDQDTTVINSPSTFTRYKTKQISPGKLTLILDRSQFPSRAQQTDDRNMHNTEKSFILETSEGAKSSIQITPVSHGKKRILPHEFDNSALVAKTGKYSKTLRTRPQKPRKSCRLYSFNKEIPTVINEKNLVVQQSPHDDVQKSIVQPWSNDGGGTQAHTTYAPISPVLDEQQRENIHSEGRQAEDISSNSTSEPIKDKFTPFKRYIDILRERILQCKSEEIRAKKILDAISANRILLEQRLMDVSSRYAFMKRSSEQKSNASPTSVNSECHCEDNESKAIIKESTTATKLSMRDEPLQSAPADDVQLQRSNAIEINKDISKHGWLDVKCSQTELRSDKHTSFVDSVYTITSISDNNNRAEMCCVEQDEKVDICGGEKDKTGEICGVETDKGEETCVGEKNESDGLIGDEKDKEEEICSAEQNEREIVDDGKDKGQEKCDDQTDIEVQICGVERNERKGICEDQIDKEDEICRDEKGKWEEISGVEKNEMEGLCGDQNDKGEGTCGFEKDQAEEICGVEKDNEEEDVSDMAMLEPRQDIIYAARKFSVAKEKNPTPFLPALSQTNIKNKSLLTYIVHRTLSTTVNNEKCSKDVQQTFQPQEPFIMAAYPSFFPSELNPHLNQPLSTMGYFPYCLINKTHQTPTHINDLSTITSGENKSTQMPNVLRPHKEQIRINKKKQAVNMKEQRTEPNADLMTTRDNAEIKLANLPKEINVSWNGTSTYVNQANRPFDSGKIITNNIKPCNHCVRSQLINTEAVQKHRECTSESNNSLQDISYKRNVYLCRECPKIAEFICSMCGKVTYCSQQCQFRGWPRHKTECVKLIIQDKNDD